MNKFTITPTLRCTDLRRKKDGTYPVELNVYDTRTKKRKYFGVGLSFTKQDFDWIIKEPTGNKSIEYKRKEIDIKKYRINLKEEVDHAKSIAEKLKVFTLGRFTELYLKKNLNTILTVDEYFKSMSQKKEIVGTGVSYDQTIKRFIAFITERNKQKQEFLFEDITTKWLKDFEIWYVEGGSRPKSLSTVGIYMRNLRAVYNEAIKDEVVPPELYPFYSRHRNLDGYVIPKTKKTLKGITEDEIAILFNAEAKTPQQQKAKDFWLFSYLSNGMNLKDIALMRFSDIKEKHFEFVRAKTKQTRKDNIDTISISLSDIHLNIFAQYGNSKINNDDYLFDIIRKTDTKEQQFKKIKNFVRFINQHLKAFAKDNGITENISYQWARHTSTQIQIKNNVPLSYISKGLGHTKIDTTMSYVGLLSIDENKDISEILQSKFLK
ncbi:MAG: site-specific integrase [Kaistella sp.]|nr:site-specific integrase [Kaistella sp.]